MTQNKKGFTLIELMVVMAIIAVLAVLMVGAIQLARNTATETIHRSNAKAVQTALESDYARNKSYCAAVATGGRLTCNTNYSLSAAYTQLGAGSLSNEGGCAAAANGGKGGGRVNTAADGTGYYIKVANSKCDAFTGTGDDITFGTATAPSSTF